MTAPQSTSAPAEGEKRTITAPLPWRLAGKGTIRGAGNNSWVCSLHWRHREGNGSLIIEAVNGYADLKARVAELEQQISRSCDDTRFEDIDAGCPRAFKSESRIRELEAALNSIRSNANCHTKEVAIATMPLIFDIATRAIRGEAA